MGTYSSVPLANIIALYEAGYSLRQIGAKVGRSHQSVALRLHRAGMTLRPRGSQTSLDPRAQRRAPPTHTNKEIQHGE